MSDIIITDHQGETIYTADLGAQPEERDENIDSTSLVATQVFATPFRLDWFIEASELDNLPERTENLLAAQPQLRPRLAHPTVRDTNETLVVRRTSSPKQVDAVCIGLRETYEGGSLLRFVSEAFEPLANRRYQATDAIEPVARNQGPYTLAMQQSGMRGEQHVDGRPATSFINVSNHQSPTITRVLMSHAFRRSNTVAAPRHEHIDIHLAQGVGVFGDFTRNTHFGRANPDQARTVLAINYKLRGAGSDDSVEAIHTGRGAYEELNYRREEVRL